MLDAYEFYHYLPVSDDAMRWGIYITGAGRGSIPAQQAYPSEGHPSLYQFNWKQGRTLPEFQVILVTEGQGTFESSVTAAQAVESNTLIFLFPGIWHRYRPDPATGWSERWISFNGEMAHGLMNQGLVCSKKALCACPDPEALMRRFDRLLARIHTNPTENSILLSMHAMDLIAELIELTLDRPLSGASQVSGLMHSIDDALVAQAMDLIWTHSHRPLSVTHLAAQLPCTRRTLERRFMAARQHSILDEINACRLSRARRLLRETELSVKTVAYLAGFTSSERMRVAFLSQEGCPPDQYRKSPRKRPGAS
jgi:AraC-like DNA-binding protein